MFDFDTLKRFRNPFTHWVGDAVPYETVLAINEAWPTEQGPQWMKERGKFANKDSLLFPARLPAPAQDLAAEMYSPAMCRQLSDLVGIELQPDPWFLEGPARPALGGGLHEIHPGGLLKMHIDFNRHPTGLVRCLNLLIYLNLNWETGWSGALELGATREQRIWPVAGRAVIFETTPDSWHGHPVPLICPPGVTRRSLALYYYTRSANADRPTTVYQR